MLKWIHLQCRFWYSIPRAVFRMNNVWNKLVAAGADPYCISLSAGTVVWKTREARDKAVRDGTLIESPLLKDLEETKKWAFDIMTHMVKSGSPEDYKPGLACWGEEKKDGE